MVECNIGEQVKESLINLYLNVKVRNSDELDVMTDIKLKEEHSSLEKTDPLLLIDYIKTSIEVLIGMQNEENALIKMKQFSAHDDLNTEIPRAYEQQIQKFEEEVRSHIRVIFIINLVRTTTKTSN